MRRRRQSGNEAEVEIRRTRLDRAHAWPHGLAATGGAMDRKGEREAKLAGALRANLRRRKAATPPAADTKPQDGAPTVEVPPPDRSPD
jgi:hypothetical protein